MAYDLQEQESLEQLKAWWERWGNLVLGVICVVCVAFAGWNGWKWYMRNEGAKATAAYAQLQNAVAQNDAKNIASIGAGILQEYPRTVFAPMAALTLAADAVKNGRPDDARRDLQWILDSKAHEEYQTVARIRLAGLALDAGSAQEALGLLTAVPAAEQACAAWHDRMGDVQFALGKTEQARAAWHQALAYDRDQQALSALIALKLSGLPVVQAQQ